MNNYKDKDFKVALVISVAVTVLIAAVWFFGVMFFSSLLAVVEPQGSQFSWLEAVILLGFGTAVGIITEYYGPKKVFPGACFFLAVWFLASVAAAQIFSFSLLFIPIFLATLLIILLIHLKSLWLIDTTLTKKLVQLSSSGHLLEGKTADLRIESGLRLLETVLPLSEAIVFRRTSDGELQPIGRARNGNSFDSLSVRQSAWCKNIALCEESLAKLETVVQTAEDTKNPARIALPLISEQIGIGVLFVQINQNFERADQYLLEAFSEQLVRNFQRMELHKRTLPHESLQSSFSNQSAQNRLNIINVVHCNIKEQTYTTLASSYLNEAYAVAYLDGTIAYMNRKIRRFAQLNSKDVAQIDLFGLLERFKTDVFNEPGLAIRRVMQTGDTFKSELYYAETNKTLDMQITLVKVPSDDVSIHETNVTLKPACFLLTFRDVSAVKENVRLRSDMAKLMSHELRTPVTSISGFAELLLMDETIGEESREFLEIISSESQRLSKMLSTFLSVSNLEQSDKQEFIKTPIKLDTVVKEVVGDLHENAKRKRIRLVEQANEHLPPVAADKGLITRAITHLIDNAIRYSPERTSVIVSTILEADFLRVVVEDRGYGIPSGEQDKIWQKFYRVARDGHDKEEESTGLGLSLVKEIIEQHGGAVDVKSEIGAGSKFSFTLPRL